MTMSILSFVVEAQTYTITKKTFFHLPKNYEANASEFHKNIENMLS